MKAYLIGGTIILVTVALSASHWAIYRAGINSKLAQDAKAIKKYQNKITGLLGELEIEKQKKKIETRTKIVRIKDVQDDCASQPINPAIFEQLQ